MPVNSEQFLKIQERIAGTAVKLIAVSKTKPISAIQELYALGQRDFGENYVQEFVEKVPQLPTDIRWHFIGHLQRNKVKQILPHVFLIHGIDSERLLDEIQKEALKINRNINVLLQLHVAKEETKFGLDAQEFESILKSLSKWPNIQVKGIMGMSSVTVDEQLIRTEFKALKQYSVQLQGLIPDASILSMGMSGDYEMAIEEGSTMIRIGSSLFGARNYSAS